MTFPPPGFFDAMVSAARDDPERFSRLGFADLRLLVEVVDADDTKRCYGLVLDGYDVEYAGEVEQASFAPDAIVRGPVEAWAEMADNIAAGGGADRAHTLNALSIADVPLRVVADDPLGGDKFFRYAETLQTLFDATGRRVAHTGR